MVPLPGILQFQSELEVSGFLNNLTSDTSVVFFRSLALKINLYRSRLDRSSPFSFSLLAVNRAISSAISINIDFWLRYFHAWDWASILILSSETTQFNVSAFHQETNFCFFKLHIWKIVLQVIYYECYYSLS